MKDILALGLLPDEEAGKYGGAGLEGDAGEAGGGAGLDAEEGNEEALRRRHVRVHKDADGFAGAHGAEEAAGEVVLVQDAVAVAAADVVDHGVDERVVEAADDHAHGIAGEGVVEAGKFPRAEVAGEDEDTAASVAGPEVVVEAFVADEVGGEVGRVGGHLAKLGEKPAEVAVFEAEDVFALGDREGRESEFQITHADATEAAEKVIGYASDEDSGGASDGARKNAQAVDEKPRDDEFKGLAKGGPGGCLRVGLACLRQGSSLVDRRWVSRKG